MRTDERGELEWIARCADLAARFAQTRPTDTVFAACDAFVLQKAAGLLCARGTRCWSALDVVEALEVVTADESGLVRHGAVETLAAFYGWLGTAGELPGEVAAKALRVLKRFAKPPRAVVRRRLVLSSPPKLESAVAGTAQACATLRCANGRATVAA